MDTPELRASVEVLYEVFASYTLRDHIDVCSHCHSHADGQLLRSKPLRQLEVDDLHGYIFSAILTWGDNYDFRHFLPRVFELLACDRRLTAEFLDPEVVINKLQYGRWREWPKREQQAVKLYLRVLWQAAIHQQSDWLMHEIAPCEEWICTIATAEDNLSPYLRIWLDDDTLLGHSHLAQLILSSEDQLRAGLFSSAFWKDRPLQGRELATWLRQGDVLDKLLRAEQIWSAEPYAAEFRGAIKLLHSLLVENTL